MKVLVTGGAGSVGAALVDRLNEKGHHVTVVGRREGIQVPGAHYRTCDITDYDQVLVVMDGIEGVIHLAALPSPIPGPAHQVYSINCGGTFNVYNAAVECGIKRVVNASSINAVGYFYGIKHFPISYLPIDEDHPPFTTDIYSFSKESVENIARYFWRRDGISGASIRIPWVYEPTEERLRDFQSGMEWARERLAPLFEEPEDRVRAFLGDLDEGIAKFRTQLLWEWPTDRKLVKEYKNEMKGDEFHMFVLGHNFFTSLDARDSAQAFERALTAEYDGAHVLFANDAHNSVGLPSDRLGALFFPEAGVKSGGLLGTESLVSIERARKLIGFEPEYSLSRFF